MYTIIGKIDNFDRKKSYKGFERKSLITAEPIKVYKCVNTRITRKKRVTDPELVLAKKAFRKSDQAKRKPQLLVSSKLN